MVNGNIINGNGRHFFDLLKKYWFLIVVLATGLIAWGNTTQAVSEHEKRLDRIERALESQVEINREQSGTNWRLNERTKATNKNLEELNQNIRDLRQDLNRLFGPIHRDTGP